MKKSLVLLVFVLWAMIGWGVVGAGVVDAERTGEGEVTPEAENTVEAEVLSDLELLERMQSPPEGEDILAEKEAVGAGALGLTAQSSVVIYQEQRLESGWRDWSWNTNRDLAQKKVVHSGTSAVGLSFKAAWGGFSLHGAQDVVVQGPACLKFWAHGGKDGQQKLSIVVNYARLRTVTLRANQWMFFEVPLGSDTTFTLRDVAFQEHAGQKNKALYLDDISIGVCAANPPTPTPVPSPTAVPTPAPTLTPDVRLAVDMAADRHAISPYVYGMNFADEALAAELDLPVRRWGGNATTRYNWRNDVSNRASDWYFESIPNPHANPGNLPTDSSVERFVEQDRRTNTASLLTISMIGWLPKSRDISCSFSVTRYGAQQQVDPWRKDCGNGVRRDGSKITANPRDYNVQSTPQDIKKWIQQLNQRFGAGNQGGVQFVSLDNEPMLWHSTHRDVHPNPVSYDELRDLSYAYAAAVKEADPSIQTLGPVSWGWTDYFYSALDQAPGGAWWSNPRDRNAHGGKPLVEWYLQQMQAYEQQHGVRLLDYLDVHFYPQVSGVALSPAGGDSTQALRLRSTRALWDPNYRDESWINEPVQLIPRLKSWVANNYPGTKIALTEYNWGALDHLNGALAQSDILGVFGREGLDLATLWDPPDADEPGAFAFRMYRNYNGAGGQFGETSVRATTSDVDRLSVFAAQRSDGALTIMVINKSKQNLGTSLSLAGVNAGGPVEVYRYSNANLDAIAREADLAIGANGLTTVFPSFSVTLLVVPTQP